MSTSVLEYSPPLRFFRRRAVRRFIVAIGLLALLVPAGYVGVSAWRKHQAEKEARRVAAPLLLVEGAYAGDVAKVKQALADGASPNTVDRRISCTMAPEAVLTEAVRARRIDVATVLLDAGANPNTLCANSPIGRTILSYATMMQDIEMVNLLLRKGADPNRDKGSAHTPLRWAGYLHNSALLVLLLTSGADAKDADENGRTLLHVLAWRGDVSDIELAIKYGALVNETDDEGKTPLDIAFREENRVVLKRAGGVVGAGIDAEAD